jgi:uracil-DNA glycosylase
MPGCRVVYTPHPVQLLSAEALDSRADAIFPEVLAALTGPTP